jgi:hypothetical protein
MTSGPALRRFAFAYGAAFAILYVVARARGLALFTVYPSLGVVLPGMHRSRDVADPAVEFLAPEMWWYGWTATAALGALAVGLLGASLPEHAWRWLRPDWLWLIPLIAMAACVDLAMPWLRR